VLKIKKEIFLASTILLLIISISTISSASANETDLTTSTGRVVNHYELTPNPTGIDTIEVFEPDPSDPKKGKKTQTVRIEEWTPAQKMTIEMNDAMNFPGIVKQKGATRSYNCHSFTFDKSNQFLSPATNLDPSGQNGLNVVIADQGYTKVTGKAMVGDVVVYRIAFPGDITHSGKVTKVDAAGMVTEVQSKWGEHAEYKHAPTNVPSIYGTNIMVLRTPMANPEIGSPVISENSNLFEIEEALEIEPDSFDIESFVLTPDELDAALDCGGQLSDFPDNSITFEFEMEVTQIDGDDEGLLEGILGIGDPIHGTYTFDPEALDIDPTSEFGVFDVDAYSLHFDSVVYENVPPFSPGFDAIFIANDFFGFDEYAAEAFNLEQQSGPAVTEFGSFFFALDDTDQTVFDDDSLPLSPPELSEFEENFAQLFLSDFDLGEDDFSVTSPQQLRSQLETQQTFIQINGIITSLELQPTPTPPQPPVVGGEFLLTDSTALLLTGAQSFSWMIPVILSGIGIGLFVVSRKS